MSNQDAFQSQTAPVTSHPSNLLHLQNPKTLYNELTPNSKHAAHQTQSHFKRRQGESANKENCVVSSHSTLVDLWQQREATRSLATRSDSRDTEQTYDQRIYLQRSEKIPEPRRQVKDIVKEPGVIKIYH